MQQQSPSLEFREEGLDCAPDSFQLLEGDVLELDRAGPKASGFYAVVEDCTPSEAIGVELQVGGLYGLEDGGYAVLFGHRSPPLEIALELLEKSDGARPGSRRGDHVVEFSKVKRRHWDCKV